MQYRRISEVVTAEQWNKAGDLSADKPLRPNGDGQLVQAYKRKDVPGSLKCRLCNLPVSSHGWIDPPLVDVDHSIPVDLVSGAQVPIAAPVVPVGHSDAFPKSFSKVGEIDRIAKNDEDEKKFLADGFKTVAAPELDARDAQGRRFDPARGGEPNRTATNETEEKQPDGSAGSSLRGDALRADAPNDPRRAEGGQTTLPEANRVDPMNVPARESVPKVEEDARAIGRTSPQPGAPTYPLAPVQFDPNFSERKPENPNVTIDPGTAEPHSRTGVRGVDHTIDAQGRQFDPARVGDRGYPGGQVDPLDAGFRHGYGDRADVRNASGLDTQRADMDGLVVCPGDYVITYSTGERATCKPDQFPRLFAKVNARETAPFTSR